MPVYVFEHPKTGEKKELYQKHSDEHVFTDSKGVKWNRIFCIPYTKIDPGINPFSEKDFAEKTKNKNYTIGDMWDLSGELSRKRESLTGRDEVKEKHAKSQQKRKRKQK